MPVISSDTVLYRCDTCTYPLERLKHLKGGHGGWQSTNLFAGTQLQNMVPFEIKFATCVHGNKLKVAFSIIEHIRTRFTLVLTTFKIAFVSSAVSPLNHMNDQNSDGIALMLHHHQQQQQHQQQPVHLDITLFAIS